MRLRWKGQKKGFKEGVSSVDLLFFGYCCECGVGLRWCKRCPFPHRLALLISSSPPNLGHAFERRSLVGSTCAPWISSATRLTAPSTFSNSTPVCGLSVAMDGVGVTAERQDVCVRARARVCVCGWSDTPLWRCHVSVLLWWPPEGGGGGGGGTVAD